jgi:hypothetical protein
MGAALMQSKKLEQLGSTLGVSAPVLMLVSSLVLVLVVGSSGCMTSAPMGGPSSSRLGATRAGYTPAEQNLRRESTLFSKSSAQGCLAGAAAGALIGILSSRDDTRGAIIGALGGCAVGVGANAYVQHKRGQYRSSEARINAMIADLRADNAKLSRLIATTQTVIADDKRKIAQVKAGLRDKQLSVAEASAQLARVRENRRLLANTIADVQQKEDDWVQISQYERQSGANTAKLDSEIGVLKDKVATLKAEAALIDREIAATPAAA